MHIRALQSLSAKRIQLRATAKYGFTIVELLVVIVVVGILASLAFVAYSGVQRQAQAAAMSSTLNQVSKKISLYYADTGLYPSSLSEAQIEQESGVSLNYSTDSGPDGPSYCVTAFWGDMSYYVTPLTAPQEGQCDGHSYLLASGGSVSEYVGDGTNGINGQSYRVHAFTTVGTDTFTVDSALGSVDIDYLIVAGGGGGGYRHAAGGGGGGVVQGSGLSVSSGDEIEVQVGAGGLGSTGTSVRAQNGDNSSLNGVVAFGGGGGGQYDTYRTGSSGGSGGGSTTTAAAAGQLGQGYSGGINSTGGSPYNHGGGGGAGGVGQNGTVATCGDGGPGLYVAIFSLFGEGGYFAGGGGGGSHNAVPTDGEPGAGGIGGGGASGVPGVSNPGESGTANTGGGGGGASTSSGGTHKGGDGGSGVVLIRYPI